MVVNSGHKNVVRFCHIKIPILQNGLGVAIGPIAQALCIDLSNIALRRERLKVKKRLNFKNTDSLDNILIDFNTFMT